MAFSFSSLLLTIRTETDQAQIPSIINITPKNAVSRVKTVTSPKNPITADEIIPFTLNNCERVTSPERRGLAKKLNEI